MKHSFEKEYMEFVVPYAPPVNSLRRIIVPENKIKKVKELAQAIANAKTTEAHHTIDGLSEYKRQYTGILGEAALEEFFGIEIIDYSIGNSNEYNIADLSKVGLNIGVKTVEVWKFPIVHKNPKRPELICVKRKDNEVVLFGYASIKILEKFQTDRYILDKNLKSRGTKSAFYGFSELIEINSFNELINTYKKIR